MLLPQDLFTEGDKKSNAESQPCRRMPALPPHCNMLLWKCPVTAIPQGPSTALLSGQMNRKPEESRPRK